MTNKDLIKKNLTFSYLQTKTDIIENSVDTNETARNKPSHLDLHYLPFYFYFFILLLLLLFLTNTSVCNNGHVQTRRWNSFSLFRSIVSNRTEVYKHQNFLNVALYVIIIDQ